MIVVIFAVPPFPSCTEEILFHLQLSSRILFGSRQPSKDMGQACRTAETRESGEKWQGGGFSREHPRPLCESEAEGEEDAHRPPAIRRELVHAGEESPKHKPALPHSAFLTAGELDLEGPITPARPPPPQLVEAWLIEVDQHSDVIDPVTDHKLLTSDSDHDIREHPWGSYYQKQRQQHQNQQSQSHATQGASPRAEGASMPPQRSLSPVPVLGGGGVGLRRSLPVDVSPAKFVVERLLATATKTLE